jgi:hypothetical protein
MKKILLSLSLLLAAPAFAQHGYNHGYHHHGGGNRWVAPLVIGGVIGYAMNQNRPIVVQQPPVVVQQPPVVMQQPGVYSLPQSPYNGATPLYEKRSQYDYACNCYVIVYNQIGWQ